MRNPYACKESREQSGAAALFPAGVFIESVLFAAQAANSQQGQQGQA